MQEEIYKTVLIYHFPLSVSFNTLLTGVSKDKLLNQAIDELVDELEIDDIEVFRRDYNLLVTEKGYRMSVYEEDVLKYQKEQEIK